MGTKKDILKWLQENEVNSIKCEDAGNAGRVVFEMHKLGIKTVDVYGGDYRSPYFYISENRGEGRFICGEPGIKEISSSEFLNAKSHTSHELKGQ